MTLAYIIDGGLFDGPGMGLDLYEQFPVVRDVYHQAAECAGLEPDRLLRWELPRLPEYRKVGALRQAALALGLCDVLAVRGLRPDITTGVSLGGMISACVAGAITRADLFRLLGQMGGLPEPTGPAQGAAFLVLPAGVAAADLLGTGVEGVYIAVDGGATVAGGVGTLVLTGYRAALEELAAKVPAGLMQMLPEITVAFHSPLFDHVQDFLEPHLAAIEFKDPELLLGSCMEPRLLTTAADVREMFLRNQSSMVSLPHLYANLAAQDTHLAALIGPGRIDRFPGALPFPVLHLETVEQVLEGVVTIYELGEQPLGV